MGPIRSYTMKHWRILWLSFARVAAMLWLARCHTLHTSEVFFCEIFQLSPAQMIHDDYWLRHLVFPLLFLSRVCTEHKTKAVSCCNQLFIKCSPSVMENWTRIALIFILTIWLGASLFAFLMLAFGNSIVSFLEEGSQCGFCLGWETT